MEEGLKKKLLLIFGPTVASFFLLIFVVFIAVFLVLGIFDSDDSSSSGGVVQNETVVSICDEKAAQLIAMIVYKEVNGTSLFAKLNTASIILNNAGGVTYNSIYNLSDNVYANFSSYKNSSFYEVVPEANRGELLYVAQVVLTGKYNLPKNVKLQASESIVTQNGNVWAYVEASPMDVYFGYEGNSLESTDILGNSLVEEAYSGVDSSVNHYMALANTLEQSDYSSYTVSSVCKTSSSDGGCGFTISSTTLSKTSFKEKLVSYADSVSSNHKSSFQLFADNADNIYDIAVANNINPELVVVRANAEGFSPGGSTNNYWGIGCFNDGSSVCKNYSSFTEGVNAFVENISKYSSLQDMMSKYAYIGKYWYNPGSSSLGGCYYLSYIYDDSNIPATAKNACAVSAPACSKDNTSNCTKTTDADQEAYANWQVEKMTNIRNDIFGELDNSMCSPAISNDIKTMMNLSDKDAWLALTGTSTNYNNVSKETMDSRVTTITVPIRVWASSDEGDMSTEKIDKKLTVNSALAPLFSAFFNDIYNEAPEFVMVSSEVACYNYRNATGSNSLSAHAYGAACDINWTTKGNGYGDTVYTEEEWNSLKESKVKHQIIYKNSKVVQIAHRYTLSWGGEWNSSTDAMHFSFIKDKTREYLKSEFGGNL